MGTFSFKKPIEECEDPELLPEAWYKARISKDPVIEPNKKKKAGGESAEGAGDNLVVNVRTIVDDAPEFSGRTLTGWFPMPTEADEETFDNRGQRTSDAKMQRIAALSEGFGGGVDGAEFTLFEGAVAGILIVQTLNEAGTELINSWNTFAKVKSLEELEELEEIETASEPDESEDGIPF